MKNDPMPVVSVIGWSNIREEVSLNLAKYLVTRIGKDDTVSEIISKLDIHILFSKSLPASSSNVSTSPCPSSQFSLDNKLKASLDSWSSKKHDLFRVDLVSGPGRVSPALVRMSSCLKCTQVSWWVTPPSHLDLNVRATERPPDCRPLLLLRPL